MTVLAIIVGIYVFGWFVSAVGFCVYSELNGEKVDVQWEVPILMLISLFWPLLLVYLVVWEASCWVIVRLASLIVNKIRAAQKPKVKLTKG